MKIPEKKASTIVSVPLNRLQFATIRRLALQKNRNNMRPLQPNNPNVVHGRSEAMDMKAPEGVEGRMSSSVKQSDALLLLSLSNTNVLNDEKDALPSKIIESEKIPDVIILDEDEEKLSNEIASKRHKVTIPKPVVDKNCTSKNNDDETEIMCFVTKEDYEILNLIKEKRLKRKNILRIIRRDLETERRITKPDMNNNSQIPVLDLSDNQPAEDMGDEKLKEVVSHSNQNKILVNNMFGLLQTIQQKKNCERSRAFQKINISAVVHEVVTKIVEICQDTTVKTYFNTMTQTCMDITEELGCSESELNEKYGSQQVQNVATNNVEVAQQPMLNRVTETSTQLEQARPVQVSPIPGDLPNGPQTQMQKQYIPIKTFNAGPYPNTPMMSALELTEPLYRQHANYNGNGNTSYMRPPMVHQQPFLAAAANTATDKAVPFPFQTATASNSTQGTPITTQAVFPPTTQNHHDNRCQVTPTQNMDDRTRPQKNRRFKHTMPRTAPYNAAGPRFAAPPSLNKYRSLMEQQKMDQQQQMWQSQLQNYPNTAWDHMYGRNPH